jgi:hypothetical protein
MNNSLRAGTFNRSAQTQLGGESVEIMRTSSNITITDDDCSSKLGKSLVPGKSTLKRLIDFKVIVDGKNKTLVEDAEQAVVLT